MKRQPPERLRCSPFSQSRALQEGGHPQRPGEASSAGGAGLVPRRFHAPWVMHSIMED